MRGMGALVAAYLWCLSVTIDVCGGLPIGMEVAAGDHLHGPYKPGVESSRETHLLHKAYSHEDNLLQRVIRSVRPLESQAAKAAASASAITSAVADAVAWRSMPALGEARSRGEAGKDVQRVQEIREEEGTIRGHARRQTERGKVLRAEDAKVKAQHIEDAQANAQRAINMQKAVDRAHRERMVEAEAAAEKKWLRQHSQSSTLKGKLKQIVVAANKEFHQTALEAKMAKAVGHKWKQEAHKQSDPRHVANKEGARMEQLAQHVETKALKSESAAKEMKQQAHRAAKMLQSNSNEALLGQSAGTDEGRDAADDKDLLETKMEAEVSREAEAILVEDTNKDEKAMKREIQTQREKFKKMKQRVASSTSTTSDDDQIQKQTREALTHLQKEASWVEIAQRQTRDEARNVLLSAAQLKTEVDAKLSSTEAMLEQLKNKRAIRLMSQRTDV